MDDGLDEETAAKYDEIRAIASKNWLTSASVSLAKLDQVKAKVYNVGLEIKAVAPGKGNASQGTSASGSQTTIQLDTDPPLANVMSQRTAWGSNTSIPDLIRQQSERQRPESASVSRRVRPPSGRRARPESAKEPGSNGTGNGKLSFGISVKGAKYDPASRPPKSTPHQNVTTGWVGPPPGVVLDPNAQEDNSVQKYAKRNGRQVAKLSMAYAGDLTEPFQPPPPAGSPDMIDMIRNTQGNSEGEFLSDDSFFSGDEKPVKMRPRSGGKPPRPSSGKKKGKQKKGKLLRRPTPEPIHFSLPTADIDESADLDTDRLIGSTDAGNASPVQFQSKPGFSYIHADIGGQLLQDGRLLSEKVTPTLEPVRNGEIHVDDEDDDFILNMIDDDDDGDTDDAGINLEPESPKHNVQFDEANNITVGITPRNRGRPASATTPKQSKNYSGRSDLRYVKSRVDSGVSLSSVPSASTRHTGSGCELTGKSESRPASTTGRVRSLVSRQRSTGKMKIPTVAVAYSDDPGRERLRKTVPTATVEVGYLEEGQENREESESMKRAREGLLTMVAQITESESWGQWVEEPGRPTLPRKYVSEKERNYYKDAVGEKVEKKVTTKTLTLTGNDVLETKLIRTIDVQDNRRREYQVPEENRPPKRTVAQDQSRPTSARKPTTSSDAAANHIPQSQNDIGASKKTALTGTSTYRVKPRPASSQAVKTNQEKSKADTGNRPKSASAASLSFTTVKDQPASSVTTAFVGKPDSKPESTYTGDVHKDSIKVSDAFKAIRQSGFPRTFNNDRVYASYTRAKSAPVKSKRKPAVEVEPVYIFTRKNEVDWDSPDVQECKDIHSRLKANGVNVAVETLKRALLPPMGNSYYITPCDKPSLPDYSSGLLSSPEVWLAAEFQRLKLANKAVERANERLFMQKQAEQKREVAAMKDLKERPASATTTKKKKKPGKGTDKKKPKRVQSAGL